MRRRHQDAPTPWVIEPDPMVAQPTATGRAVLKAWIDEQLRLVADARRRRQERRHHLRRHKG